ncbi:hydroxyacid dehydrogenase [Leifsonia sp. NPDC058230]|uniref:hydroxyacid dehydrogenase n=1 Tax=Leifsonia sp. NPDC058230 TaxID=3346391 RepID=UPI0036D885B0
MTSGRIPALMTLDPVWQPKLFDSSARERLSAVLDLSDAPASAAQLERVEVLITGWGSPYIDDRELDAMPRLRAVFHSAGTLRGIVAPSAWERQLLVTSAADANAIPVAEYTIAMILLAGKRIDDAVRRFRRTVDLEASRSGSAGNFRTTVGIVGASRIGKRVLELLEAFDLEVLVSDPTLDEGWNSTSARLVELDELLAASDVVSLHAPLLPRTRGMIGHRELHMMQPGATLINTARGGLVDHAALAQAVADHGLHAVLDVTDPEPLPLDHPLRHLDSVILTPHIAGAAGNEVHRLGESVVDEVERFAAGLPPRAAVSAAELSTRA